MKHAIVQLLASTRQLEKIKIVVRTIQDEGTYRYRDVDGTVLRLSCCRRCVRTYVRTVAFIFEHRTWPRVHHVHVWASRSLCMVEETHLYAVAMCSSQKCWRRTVLLRFEFLARTVPHPRHDVANVSGCHVATCTRSTENRIQASTRAVRPRTHVGIAVR